MKHPTKNIERRVGVAGCKHTTQEFIAGLARQGLLVDHCLTIDPEKGTSQQVAGYCDLRPFLDEQAIPYTVAKKYSLEGDDVRGQLVPLQLDVLLVIGWQRIIPDWFLEELSIGAFGMHGSNKPLPHGRGRSPMNWSLIQNKSLFFTHLFQYLPGVDDGPIVGVQMFDITPFDTCLTLHVKNTQAMIRLCAEHLPSLMDGTANVRPQPKQGVSFYPKRSPEDGLIYWQDSTLDIYNLIRAVTRPFAGACCYLDDDPQRRVVLWRAVPFDTHIVWPEAKPGEIVEVLIDGSFIVKTGDTSLFVQEYEGATLSESDTGRRLGHLDKPRKVWEDLPT